MLQQPWRKGVLHQPQVTRQNAIAHVKRPSYWAAHLLQDFAMAFRAEDIGCDHSLCISHRLRRADQIAHLWPVCAAFHERKLRI